nr:hypothetical protein BaRGS_025047 [Batillaria attramentaria]
MPALFRVTMSLPSIPRLIRLTAMAAVLIVTVHLVSLALSDPIPSPPTSSPGESQRRLGTAAGRSEDGHVIVHDEFRGR